MALSFASQWPDIVRERRAECSALGPIADTRASRPSRSLQNRLLQCMKNIARFTNLGLMMSSCPNLCAIAPLRFGMLPVADATSTSHLGTSASWSTMQASYRGACFCPTRTPTLQNKNPSFVCAVVDVVRILHPFNHAFARRRAENISLVTVCHRATHVCGNRICYLRCCQQTLPNHYRVLTQRENCSLFFSYWYLCSTLGPAG